MHAVRRRGREFRELSGLGWVAAPGNNSGRRALQQLPDELEANATVGTARAQSQGDEKTSMMQIHTL